MIALVGDDDPSFDGRCVGIRRSVSRLKGADPR